MGEGQPLSRAESWAETMHGNIGNSDIRLAHVDSSAGTGSDHSIGRVERESIEDTYF